MCVFILLRGGWQISFFWEICNLPPLVSKGANKPVSVSGSYFFFFLNFNHKLLASQKKTMCHVML